MSASAQAKFSDTINRLHDALLDQRVRREEAAQALADADLEAARRQRQRANAEQRTQIQAVYADAYRAFGTEVPAPIDDEPVERYRARLFNRLARKLAPDHELSSIRADDLGSQAVVFDNFERMLLDAARQEGEKPSEANLPDNGMVMRTRTDANTGTKYNELYGKRAFIADMGRPGRKVLAIIDRNTGQSHLGPFSSSRPLMPDARHHQVHPAVVFVIGSPAPLYRGNPPRYSPNQRQPWRPQRSIPSKQRQSRAHRALARRSSGDRIRDRPRDDDAPPRSLARMVG